VIEPLHLTKKEEKILDEHYRKSQTTLIRARAHAVLLNHEGYRVPEIATIVRVEEKTVRKWVQNFKQTRSASIFPAYTGNTNAAKLTSEQKEEIKKALESPPRDDGLPSTFWSVGKLKEYLRAEYGVVYESERSYHHLFAYMHYSFKLPEERNWRRDDDLVQQRMLEIQQEIKEKKRQGYTIFAADECSLCWETTIRRAWMKRGEPTFIRTESDKKRQHYFGALNLNTHKEELIPLMWQDTTNTIEALRELTQRYPHQKLALIWDNAKWHRSKELRQLLGDEFKHIHLMWLPPYAPDENPQEQVWRIGKDAVANREKISFDDLKRIFEESISNRRFNYQMG
jgi:transposase